jgi:hypothetical protein
MEWLMMGYVKYGLGGISVYGQLVVNLGLCVGWDMSGVLGSF